MCGRPPEASLYVAYTYTLSGTAMGRAAPVLLRHCGGQEADSPRDYRRGHRRPRQAPAAPLNSTPHDVPPIGHHIRLQQGPQQL